MKTTNIIPPAVAAILPYSQLRFTKESEEDFSGSIKLLEAQLHKCPKIGKTDGMKEHPAIFHYFYGGTDMYICEYDPDDDLLFGYTILNADLDNSEWGYTSLAEIRGISVLNIDYHFEAQSIEAALYKQYPRHFKKPKSLALPDIYDDAPFMYKRTHYGVVLMKCGTGLTLFHSGAEKFFSQCRQALQEGRSISEVINGYFDFDE
jgi:hypothetical protein